MDLPYEITVTPELAAQVTGCVCVVIERRRATDIERKREGRWERGGLRERARERDRDNDRGRTGDKDRGGTKTGTETGTDRDRDRDRVNVGQAKAWKSDTGYGSSILNCVVGVYVRGESMRTRHQEPEPQTLNPKL